MNTEEKIYSVRSRAKNIVGNNDASCNKEDLANKPYHKIRDSLISTSSYSKLNNWGISNICLIILILSNVIVAIDSIAKYGVTLNPLLWLKIYFNKLIETKSVLILSGLNFFPLSSLGLEIFLSKGILNDKLYLALIILFLSFEILIPLFVIKYIDNYAIAFTIIVSYITVFLKLISYHMTNYWCRQKNNGSGDKTKSLIQYPDNLKIKDIYYFLFAPTLCYELNFPLLPNIRKRFLFRKAIEMLLVISLILSIIQQSIVPIVVEYQDSFWDLEYIKIVDLYMKFTIPFFTFWLLWFYFFFEIWLNIIGEIARFGDRHFYDDWWNCETVIVWWRKWNIPVHKWCARHMYVPMVKSGYTRFQAACAVFFVSAILHEYVFSAPLKIFKIFTFLGIFFGQMMTFAFESDKPSKYGNIGFFAMNAVGLPFNLLYYYYGFFVEHCKES